MHELDNPSPWAALIAPGYSHKREQLAIVIIKAGYDINPQTGELTPLDKTPDIVAADQHAGDPLKSALMAANECSAPKVGGEFYILGATLTPPNTTTPACEASLTLTQRNGKTFNKTLRVVGKRRWAGNWLTPRISQPEPLTPTSLGYENAYGGTDAEASPQDKHPSYLANYAGRGYLSDSKRCKEIELPQIETAPYINSPADHPSPAGLGPLPAFWSPRRAEQGTPDLAAAQRGTCPFGPDAQASMNNSAPLDQRFAQPWQGGEVLTLTNLLSGLQYGKPISITLPNISPQLILTTPENNSEGDKHEADKILKAVCDTFWIDAEKNQLFLIYRAAYPIRWSRPNETIGSVSLRDAAAAALTTETESEAA
jgi:hypothetical protein